MQANVRDRDTTETIKAIAGGVVVFAAFWGVFLWINALVLAPTQTDNVMAKLPPPDPFGRTVSPYTPLTRVEFHNAYLIPVGQPKAMDKTKLAFVGQTSEGFGLWTEKPAAGGKPRVGGGGGPGTPRAVPAATGPVYLRTADGRWWQVLQQEQGPMPPHD